MAGLLWATNALAAPADSDAQQLADAAIFTDYLQLDFRAGEKKLEQALALCKKRGCSPTVHAQVYRDLAVIYVTGMKKEKEGEELLLKALKLDPDIALDADLTTPELLDAFEGAKATLAQRSRGRRSGAKKQSEQKPSEQAEAEVATEPEEQDSDSAETPVAIGSEDCPPDFPGCEALGEGDTGEDSRAADEETGVSHWLSIAVQQDFLRFAGQSGVCRNTRPEELSCFQEGDAYQDPDRVLGSGGEVSGGFQLATTRLLVGYERDLFLPNLRLGAWLGYALGGGPAEPGGPGFIPFHAEVRGKYRFPLDAMPIVPFASLGAGFAQVDSSVDTQLIDQNQTTGVGELRQVTVWQKTGTTFVSFGGGALYPLGEASSLSAQLQWTALFPSSGGALALAAAYTHGF